MKKIKSVLFSTLLAIGLVACGSESGDNSCATKTDTTNTTQQTTTTAATAQTECSLQSATPDPVVGDTMHEYHLSFDIPTGAVKKIGFSPSPQEVKFSITPGLPWAGMYKIDYPYVPDLYTFELVIKAGRQTSNTPTDWFNDRNKGAKFNSQDWANMGSFNFAIEGQLIINQDRYNVVIGQEYREGLYGWWIAGEDPGWTYHKPSSGSPYLLTPDGKWEIKRSDFSYSFKIGTH